MSNAARRDAPPGSWVSYHGSRGLASGRGRSRRCATVEESVPLPLIATRRAIVSVAAVTALHWAFSGPPPSAQTPAAQAPAQTAAAAPRPPQSVLGATPAAAACARAWAGHRSAVCAAGDPAGRHRRAALSARFAAAQGRSHQGAGGLQHDRRRPRPHRQHRQHPQSVDRAASRARQPEHRRGGDRRRGRRPQHAQRRVGGLGLRPVLLQLRRQHDHPAQPAAPRRLRRR